MKMLLVALLLAQEPTAEQLIEKLRSSSAEEREAAMSSLRKLGPFARPLLEKAAQDKDADLALRAKDILASLAGQASLEDFQKINAAMDQARTMSVKFQVERSTSDGYKYPPQYGELLLKDG